MFQLIGWYKKNKRELPWRETSDPYKIWLSEIILQQTRVNQGLAYYNKFIGSFPSVEKLAAASFDEVLKLWQGLGYYSRGRNLLIAAKQIIERYDGKLPESFDQLKSLKGIGDYTAAAIASIAFNIPVAVVDGNVIRVLSRLFEISEPYNTSKGKKIFCDLADKLLDRNNPGIYNQALMELGALICLPKSPGCTLCPISDKCAAYHAGTTLNFPVKTKKSVARIRYLYYYIVSDKKNVLIRQRKEKDIWQGLYEFPVIESKVQIGEGQILINLKLHAWFTQKEYQVKFSSEFKHILSHQIIYARFAHISVSRLNSKNIADLIEINLENIDEFAFPRLITRYLENNSIR